jgi:hypothetical protein
MPEAANLDVPECSLWISPWDREITGGLHRGDEYSGVRLYICGPIPGRWSRTSGVQLGADVRAQVDFRGYLAV